MPCPRDSSVNMPPSSSSGCAVVCIRRAVVCRRRKVNLRPVTPVSIDRGFVSTHGDGTWACPKMLARRSRQHAASMRRRRENGSANLKSAIKCQKKSHTICSAVLQSTQTDSQVRGGVQVT